MANPNEEADYITAAADDDLNFDPLDDGELKQELNSDSLQNPNIHTSSKQHKETKAEAEKKENKDGKQNDIKSTILISGLVVAVVGAIFAVFKKIKEA